MNPLRLCVRVALVGFVFLASGFALRAADAPPAGRKWVSLFDGKTLDGWTIKIAGRPLGENYAETFRVEDGILKVYYDRYPQFKGPAGPLFGHLYTNIAYSRYILRMEYRFIGKMMADGPGYVNLNSGVMIHAQSPQSMTLDQGFPASLEVQFLADEGKGPRPTANVCTPGTNLELGGKLVTQHIVQSTSPTFPAEEWVQIEAEVHGSDEVIYRVNGREVLRYQKPQLDPTDPTAQRLLAAGAPLLLNFGHIALQAEGQPVWFRNIELMSLETP